MIRLSTTSWRRCPAAASSPGTRSITSMTRWNRPRSFSMNMFEWRGRGAFFLVAAHVQVVVLVPPVGQPVDERRVAVVGEDRRPVDGEQRVELGVLATTLDQAADPVSHMPPPSTCGPTPISACGPSPRLRPMLSSRAACRQPLDGKPSPPPEPAERLRLAIFSAARTDTPVALALRRMIYLVLHTARRRHRQRNRPPPARRPARRPPRTDRPSGRAQPRRDRRPCLATGPPRWPAGDRPGNGKPARRNRAGRRTSATTLT